ncbi:type I-E CRISPR-associated protein Cas5/CasD, partial [Hansschlegelia beijingensis]
RGWTTRGRPEGRAGGAGTYASPHIRRRDYDCDMAVTVVLRLEPSDEAPTLYDVAAALMEPARPLFLGRKSCLPAGPIVPLDPERRFVEAETLAAALAGVPAREPGDGRILLPEEDPEAPGDELRWITDARDWRSGVHAGSRRVRLRTIAAGGGR